MTPTNKEPKTVEEIPDLLTYDKQSGSGFLDDKKVMDFMLSIQKEARLEEQKRVVGIIEERMGKHKSHSGSLGYQGLVNGIQSFQNKEDQDRDEIIKQITSTD